MSVRYTLFSLFMLCSLGLFAQSQSNFQPNSIFVAKHTKNKPAGLFTNGTRVTVFLESGEKVKGELLIYGDSIDVNYQKIGLSQIVGIRRNNSAIYWNAASGVAFGEVSRRAFGFNSTEALALSAGLIAVSTFVFNGKRMRKFPQKRGWTYAIRQLGRYDQVQGVN